MFSKETLLKHITIDPKIMVGKPVIKGTRVPVQQVLRLLAQGIVMEEIMQDYDLTREDIFACLLYATEMLENTTILPIQAF
jgi:uncharacterized protein (DUF433 family)